MKMKRKLRTIAGVLLILMFASGTQAVAVVLDKTDFMRGTETDFEFQVLFDVPVLAILRGLEIVGAPLFGSGMFNFQAEPGISTADVNKVAGGGSVLSMPRLSDLGLSRLKVSDEPVPTIALLILVGLIALIALKGRRR
jgi:hypothetical protein